MVMIVQMPSNVSAAAVAFAAYAGGSMKAARIIPLMTVEEGLEALKQAATIEYSPPRR